MDKFWAEARVIHQKHALYFRTSEKMQDPKQENVKNLMIMNSFEQLISVWIHRQSFSVLLKKQKKIKDR